MGLFKWLSELFHNKEAGRYTEWVCVGRNTPEYVTIDGELELFLVDVYKRFDNKLNKEERKTEIKCYCPD